MENFYKLYYLIKKVNIKKLYLLLFLMVVGAFLELLGITLIVPFMAILSESSEVIGKYFPKSFIFLISEYNITQLLVGGLSVFLTLFLIKSVYLIFLNYGINKFIFQVQAELGKKLFNKYLNNPLSFHLKNNSSFLLRNISEEIHYLSEGILLQGMIFFAESLVTLLLISFLLFINPLNTIFIILFLTLLIIVFFIVMKEKLFNWGFIRQKFGGLKIKEVNQSLGCIKELKLYKKENFFTDKYYQHALKTSRVACLQNTLTGLPRYSFELLGVISICIIVFAMLSAGDPVSQIVQFIVIFSVACFRLLPAANRIINYIQVYSYHKPVIVTLYKEFTENETQQEKNNFDKILSFNQSINVKNLSFGYNGSLSNVLEDLNFEIKKNDAIGIIGKSGAGKSTLINILLGLLSPLSGNIKLDGVNIDKNLANWQSKIGYVPQDVYLLDDTITKNIAFGLEENEIDIDKVRECIKKVFLEDLILKLPDGLNSYLGERGVKISGGQKQRLGIARSLYRNPEILILDESTNSLDKETEENFILDLFKIKNNITIIFITHKLDTLRNNFNKVYEIKDKKINEKKI